MNKTILAFASLLFLLPSCSRNSSESDLFKDKYDLDKRIQSFNDIHLEMSLKPFKVNNPLIKFVEMFSSNGLHC